MSGSRRAGREAFVGMGIAVALVGTFVGWLAGWGWLAGLSVLGVLDLAAIAAGADSRRAGDWRRVETS